jgi:hypothetical protein
MKILLLRKLRRPGRTGIIPAAGIGPHGRPYGGVFDPFNP